jgi:hypothetical protein
VQFPIGRTGQHPVPPTPLPPSVRSLVHMHWQTPSVLSLGAFFVAGKSISDFVLNSQTYRFGRTSPGSLPAAHRLSASRSSDLSERSFILPISPKVLAVWRTPRQCAAPRRALAARAETGDEDPFRNTCKQGSAYWRTPHKICFVKCVGHNGDVGSPRSLAWLSVGRLRETSKWHAGSRVQRRASA